MKVIKSILDMREYSTALKENGVKIGFVPTLGCLHLGHVDLIRQARSECDKVVVSVFVNPLQFKKEKFTNYPRNLQEDTKIASEAGANILFAPQVSEMFPKISDGHALFAWHESNQARPIARFQIGDPLDHQFVRVPGELCNKMDGYLHPWYYDGVATVVYKLFEIITPHFAYFGGKDPQQSVIIENMTRQFKLSITIGKVPTLRDNEGLAYSSRNTLLTAEQHAIALRVAKSIQRARELFEHGENNVLIIYQKIKELLYGLPELEIHYLGIMDPSTLEELEAVCKDAILYIAYSISGIRLTDNERFS